MELVNNSAIAAVCIVTTVDALPEPFGMVVAKATYRIGPRGAELDTQTPMPVLFDDEPHELGVIPCDVVPRHSQAYEIWVLAAAYPEGDAPVQRRDVAVSVGGFRRRLAVFGDRRWQSGGGGTLESSLAKPFKRMPITWDRAFGGRALVEIDREAFLEFQHVQNPGGRGASFRDVIAPAKAGMNLPDPYPLWREDDRLPNVEDPAHLIAVREDSPAPAGWAPVPRTAPFLIGRLLELSQQTPPPDVVEYTYEGLLRAPASMVLPAPPYAAEVRLEGLAPGSPVSFELPRLTLLVEFDSPGSPTILPATPCALLILPDERKFAVTYRMHFRLASGARSARLRVTEG